jgi:hypothetical protein
MRLCNEVMNAWSFVSTPPYAFMVWYVVKHKVYLHGERVSEAQDNFTFTVISQSLFDLTSM